MSISTQKRYSKFHYHPFEYGYEAIMRHRRAVGKPWVYGSARSVAWSKIIVLPRSLEFVKGQQPHVRMSSLITLTVRFMLSNGENVRHTDLPVCNRFHVLKVEFPCADEITINSDRLRQRFGCHLDPV